MYFVIYIQAALLNSGLDVRHITENVNVPMYRTNIKCINGSGAFKRGTNIEVACITPYILLSYSLVLLTSFNILQHVFTGANMVVSMRPYSHKDVIQSAIITSRYHRVHGAPVHIGDPTIIGISKSLQYPDFGDPVTIQEVRSYMC